MRLKTAFLLLTLLFAFKSRSQNEWDALRYSRNFPTGTARFTSMGGAFGALGGDISCSSNNPAGLGVFRKHQFSVSPGLSVYSQRSSYFNNVTSDSKVSLNLGSAGVVFAADIRDKKNPLKGWQFVNFAISYNRTADFNQRSYIEGVNPKDSYLDIFQANANNGTIDPFYEQLAINTALLLKDNSTGKYFAFGGNWPNTNKLQRKTFNSTGSSGEVNLAFAANYANRLYMGMGVNIATLNYMTNAYHYEENRDSSVAEFNNFTFHEYVRTRGTGVNLKFGLIYRITDFMRIGASFHSPTWYLNMRDNYTNDMLANYKSGSQLTAVSPLGFFNYAFRTPLRAQASVGFVISKLALIGLEYEFADMSQARYNTPFASFNSSVNGRISSSLNQTHTVKAGAELKLEPFSIRAGFNYITSPYAPNVNRSTVYSYTAGVGYRSRKGFFVDAAYALLRYKEFLWLYDPTSVGGVLGEPANLTNNRHSIIFTFGVNF